MPPDVSVIIAAHNVEAYIGHAIRSALEQRDIAVEIIVINDASTDNTAATVARIGDTRLKLIDLPANGGPGAARNAGLEAASAPWIAILDGDDSFLPGRLKKCLARARATDADIVVDNLNVCREADGATYPMFPPKRFSRFSFLNLADFISGNRSFLGGMALGYLKPMFKTEFLRRHALRYDPDLRIGEDYLLMCEALANGARCAVVSEPGYLYTVRAGSISYRLTPTDVDRIAAGDKKFLMRYKLDATAARAQKQRDYALKEARAFTKLIDALKRRDFRESLKATAECPPAVRHLWRAAWVRTERLFKRPRHAYLPATRTGSDE